MILVDALQYVLNAQGGSGDVGDIITGIIGSIGGGGGGGGHHDWQGALNDVISGLGHEQVWQSKFSCGSQQGICPASSFTAIGAAFATQGYFVQADLLYYLTSSDFGLWAPLLYIMAAVGGLISLAMGAPPKMYLWFFMGPALYNWLLETREPVHGVQWRIADIPQDQREVWKLAEVGLKNLNVVKRGLQQGSDLEPRRLQPTHDPVYVSNLFLWFDELISSTVQWMVRWTGIYTLRGGRGGGAGADGDGIIKAPTGAEEHDRWYLLSNLKWSMLENITGARLHDADLRDAFATFMTTECGQALSGAVNKKNFIAASHSRSGRIPCTVFKEGDVTSQNEDEGVCTKTEPNRDNYEIVAEKLTGQWVPMPEIFQYLWEDKSKGSFSCFMSNNTGEQGCPGAQMSQQFAENKDILCRTFLLTLVNGFRWEAGHLYHQLVAQAPEGMGDDEMLFNLFYGWDIRDAQGNLLDGEALRNWTKDLILVHLIRNEMAAVPDLVSTRRTNSQNLAIDVAEYQRAIGGRQKYGEVYTWALMTPYLQGVMLYLLAMGYPFACILIVVPGWHRALFTWMSFWAWVKLWDIGFAIVGVLERSIWAMIGNNSAASTMAPMISVMQQWGKVTVDDCMVQQATGHGDDITFKFDPKACPPVPSVTTDGSGDPLDEHLRFSAGPDFPTAMKIFDRAMLLGANIDFDLANSYYIYIMAALYFAVPAATGQLVLGAKAGAAGMVSNMVGGAASEGGRAAGQGFSALDSNRDKANVQTQGQQTRAAWGRGAGLPIGLGAFTAGNMQTQEGLASSLAQQTSAGIGAQRDLGRMQMEALTGGIQAKTQANKLSSNPAGAFGNWLAKDSGAVQSMSDKQEQTMQRLRGGGGGGVAPTTQPAAQGGIDDGSTQGVSPMTLWYLYNSASSPITSGYITPQDVRGALGQNQAMRGYNMDWANKIGQQQDMGIAGFMAQTAQSGAGLAERRYSAGAEFGAGMAYHRAGRDLGAKLTQRHGARGVDTSGYGPPPKPTDFLGMAYMGMLGSKAYGMAHYADFGGEYWSSQGAAGTFLSNNYSGAALSGHPPDGAVRAPAYQDVSPDQAYNAYEPAMQQAGQIGLFGWGGQGFGGSVVVKPLAQPSALPKLGKN